METRKQDTSDKTFPGIDHQESKVNEFIVNDAERVQAAHMHDAVEKDRKFYDSDENPGKEFNQNDQAYSQTSPKDFVKTHSKFHHKDDLINDKNPE